MIQWKFCVEIQIRINSPLWCRIWGWCAVTIEGKKRESSKLCCYRIWNRSVIGNTSCGGFKLSLVVYQHFILNASLPSLCLIDVCGVVVKNWLFLTGKQVGRRRWVREEVNGWRKVTFFLLFSPVTRQHVNVFPHVAPSSVHAQLLLLRILLHPPPIDWPTTPSSPPSSSAISELPIYGNRCPRGCGFTDLICSVCCLVDGGWWCVNGQCTGL